MKATKFEQFMDFTMNYKLLNLAKRMKTTELVDLWQKYSPYVYDKSVSLANHTYGCMVVSIITEVLKDRYPNNRSIQAWNNQNSVDIITLLGRDYVQG